MQDEGLCLFGMSGFACDFGRSTVTDKSSLGANSRLD